MQLRAIEPQRLYQKVAEQIGDLIRQGTWREGDRLPPERDLALHLKVSRPVVREAMVALELAGFVEVRTGAGTYVRTPGSDAYVKIIREGEAGPSPFELIAARRVIEGETAAIAAEAATPGLTDGLAKSMAKMDRDIGRGVQSVSNEEDGDWQFHVRIAAATGNATLETIVSQLWLGMRRPLFRALSDRVRLPANARRALGEHRRITDCIAAGDAAGARTAMHSHLDQVRDVLMRGVEDEDAEATA
ncbi:MAG: FadR family transcriptional regulator [Rhodospirillaceae bacterium]|nr:FadR family transcriptional regulator [Rhodospirillaceae bacterium]